jgi:hypothetical protein
MMPGKRMWFWLLVFMVGATMVVPFLARAFGAVQGPGAQEPAQGTSSARQAVEERVSAYYQAIQQGNQAAAFELVAPESKNDFFNIAYHGLVAFRVVDIQFAEDPNTATVTILRTQKFAGFPQLLDLQLKDTWKQVEGRWYIVLPSTKEMDTRFGKMRLGQPGKPPDAAEIEKRMQERRKNADPAQYLKALEQAYKEAAKKKPATKDKPKENPESKP